MLLKTKILILILDVICGLGMAHGQLTACAQTNPASPPNSNAARPPFTLEQIQKHLAAGTDDEVLASMVDGRGVEFTVDAKMIAELKVLGLKPITLKALERAGQQNSRLGQTIILIADIRSVKDESNGLTETLIKKLNAALANYSDVKVIPLNERITVQQGGRELAIEKGRAHNTSIVLWGWYIESPTNFLVTINFEVLRSSRTFPITSEEKEYPATSAVAQNFTLHGNLSDELTTIVLAATALARLDVGDYWGAANRLDEALKKRVEPQMMMGYDDIFLLRSLVYIAGSATDGEVSIKKYIPAVIKDLEGFVKDHSQSTTGYFMLGIANAVSEDYDKAVAAFRKMLVSDADPEMQAQAYQMLMVVGGEKNDSKLETESANSLITISEKLSPSLLKYLALANAYDALDDEKQALENYNRALAQSPNADELARIHAAKGNIYYKQVYDERVEASDQAINENKLAVEYNPRNSAAYNRLGVLYYWKKKYQDAINSFNAALKLEPETAVVYYNLGNSHREAGNIKAADEAYQTALKYDPNNADIYYDLAVLFSNNNQPTEALRALNKCLTLDSKYVSALYDRAYIYLDRKNFEAATADYKTLVGINTKHADVPNLMGDISYWKKEYDTAIDFYTEALKLAPKTITYHNNRGNAYREANKIEDALKDYKAVLVLDPTNAFAHLNRGYLYAFIKQDDKAIPDLSKYLESYPQDTNALYERAFSFFKVKNYDAAIKDYKKLIEINPKDARALLYRGVVFKYQRNAALALKDFKAALILKADYAEVYLERGLLHLAKGRHQQARADFLKVKELSKDSKLLQQAEEQLKKLPVKKSPVTSPLSRP